MRTILSAVLMAAFIASTATAAPLQGVGRLVPSKDCRCRVDKAVFSNRAGAVWADLDMRCPKGFGSVTVRGRLDDAMAIGDGRSMKYFGDLGNFPVEVWITLLPDGTADSAMAADGEVWDLGRVEFR